MAAVTSYENALSLDRLIGLFGIAGIGSVFSLYSKIV